MFIKKYLCLSFLLLVLLNISAVQINQKIRINQLGYYINSPKIFVVADSKETKFDILNKNNEVVFSGNLAESGIYKESGEDIKIGDFSTFNKPGEYKISIDKSGYSYTFKIGNDIYSDVLKAAIKSYYYQRASMDLKEQFAGKWARKAGHKDTDLIFHKTTGKTGNYSSPGGWYDAGDYGKYIVNAGITVDTLLSLYELYPDLIKNDLNIPESNNKVSDLLDELKYEIDWMRTMQDTDGGVFFKIASLKWTDFILPENDLNQRYVIGKSTASTLDFCSVMAQTYRVFKSIDIIYADECLTMAKRAWVWAINNPNVLYPYETGGSGAYSDRIFTDEFFHAACELYISTDEKTFKEYIIKNNNIFRFSKQATWAYISNLGFFSLSTVKNNLEKKYLDEIKEDMINYADNLVNIINKSGYKIPMKEKDFIWGSNSELCNMGIILCYAFKLTNDKKYLDSVIMAVDYIFGKNATGYSFVTGFGSKSPYNIHHRPSGSDSIVEPVPGFLVGGPNKDKQDNQHYPGINPAQCYLDSQKSYASNEVSINWNASLIFLLGFIESNKNVYLK